MSKQIQSLFATSELIGALSVTLIIGVGLGIVAGIYIGVTVQTSVLGF